MNTPKRLRLRTGSNQLSRSDYMELIRIGKATVSCTLKVTKIFERPPNFVAVDLATHENDPVHLKAFDEPAQRLLEVSRKGQVLSFDMLLSKAVYRKEYHRSPFLYDLHFVDSSTARVIDSSSLHKEPVKKDDLLNVQVDDVVVTKLAMDGGFKPFGSGSGAVAVFDRFGNEADLIVLNFEEPDQVDYCDNLIEVEGQVKKQGGSLQFIADSLDKVKIISSKVDDSFYEEEGEPVLKAKAD